MKFAQQPRRNAFRGMRIGLAWMTTGSGIVWHNGETGGYASFVGFTADRRHGVVILSDAAVVVDDLGFATLNPQAEIAPTPKAIALPVAALEDYVGTYRLADNFLLKVFRVNDALFSQATGQGPVPIFPSAPNEFFARVAGISISFTRDHDGAVDELVLHQKGDRKAPKLSASELPPEPKEIKLGAGALGDYVGKYRFNFGILDVVLETLHERAVEQCRRHRRKLELPAPHGRHTIAVERLQGLDGTIGPIESRRQKAATETVQHEMLGPVDDLVRDLVICRSGQEPGELLGRASRRPKVRG